ncbi:MAG: carboxypeptidase regulatory-like domain-containing protein [Deltaproteobacteria bacterium]|nr:carboxypeptidase regulatory-like domain-containing protein [Deltaproteobacteria bacterium]
MTGRWQVGIWLALLGCTPKDAAVVPTLPGPPVPLPQPRAYAARIQEPNQLIGGPTAKGRLGDLKIWNDRIQVIIGSVDHSEGYLLSGGTILDADRIRAAGEPGQSTFGEVITAIDFRVLDPDSVEIESDGSDGGPAVITARGKEQDFPLLAAVIDGYEGRRPEKLAMRIRYVLPPSSEYLRIEYQLRNEGERPVGLSVGLLGFVFGDGATPFVPKVGFTAPREGTIADSYAAVARDVAYLYAPEHGRLNFAAAYSGLLAATFLGSVLIEPKEATGFNHLLFVGDGNLSRLQATKAAREKVPSRRISGYIRDRLGHVVADARLHVIGNDQDRVGDYVSQARSDKSGRYDLDLPLGRYELVITADGYESMRPARLTVEDREGAHLLDYTLEAPGRVHFMVHDQNGKGLPAKATVVALDRPSEIIPLSFGEPDRPAGTITVEHAIDGEGELVLPTGRHQFYFSRGAEYDVARAIVDVRPGTTSTLTATLSRVVDTPGWQSTDTHLHAQKSADSWDLYETIVAVMAAEGLELPVSTEHEYLGDFNPAIEKLGLHHWMKGIVGSEVSTGTYGHFNAYPLVPNPEVHGNGWINWYGLEVVQTFAQIRSNPADPVLQVNHPRDGDRLGYFDAMGLDPASNRVIATDRWSEDFDVIEIMNQCDIDHVESVRLPDWFGFLEHGKKKFAVGGSDSHHAKRGELGYPRTYLRLGHDDPSAVEPSELRDAVKAGRMTVTCGPFVDFQIGAAQIGDTVTTGSSTVTLQVVVRAPDWMDVDQLEVWADGQRVKTVAIGGPSGGSGGGANDGTRDRFRGPIDMVRPKSGPGWILVKVRGDRRHEVFAHGALPWAITNPIFLQPNP